VDDAVQVALIKVWRRLDQIDLDRPSTIKSVITTTGVRAMRDEVRSWLRLHRHDGDQIDNWELIAGQKEKKSDLEVSPFLRLYLKYVEDTGSFDGAHRHVANQLGVSLAYVSSIFHRLCLDIKLDTRSVDKDSQAETIQGILNGNRKKVKKAKRYTRRVESGSKAPKSDRLRLRDVGKQKRPKTRAKRYLRDPHSWVCLQNQR
jgi:hypothetical protein